MVTTSGWNNAGGLCHCWFEDLATQLFVWKHSVVIDFTGAEEESFSLRSDKMHCLVLFFCPFFQMSPEHYSYEFSFLNVLLGSIMIYKGQNMPELKCGQSLRGFELP